MTLEREIRELGDVLTCFIDQPVDGALVVACEEVACPVVVAVVDGHDQRSTADVVLAFTGACRSVADFVAAAVAEVERGLGGDDLGAAAGGSRGEGGPAESAGRVDAGDPAASPGERLGRLLGALLGRLPPGDHRLVVALVPSPIADHTGYGELISCLLTQEPRPRLRVVLRDDRAASHLPTGFDIAGDRRHHRLDVAIDGAVIEASAQAIAASPQRSPAERIPALLEVGQRALGRARPELAERAFVAALALARSGPSGGGEAADGAPLDPHMLGSLRALAHHGLGEARLAAGDLAGARAQQTAAFAVLGPAAAPVLRFVVAAALGRVLVRGGETRAAVPILGVAAAAATAADAPEELAQILTELGDAMCSIGHVQDAEEAWAAGLEVARACDSAALADDLARRLGQAAQHQE